MVTGHTLAEIATRFLASQSPDKRAETQAEVRRFIQWCGQDRPIISLTPPEVSNYAESRGGILDVNQRLEPVRSFLQFAQREGLTRSNLAPHLRVRRGPPKAASGGTQAVTVEVTAEGRAQMEQELEMLRARRPYLADEIKRAAADKDFRENAPLEAAREELGRAESRIRELEALLRSGIVGTSAATEKVALGSSLRLQDVATGEEMGYTLVGPREAQPGLGRISVSSPVGQAVVGHAAGDVVEVQTPSGPRRYQVLLVSGPSAGRAS